MTQPETLTTIISTLISDGRTNDEIVDTITRRPDLAKLVAPAVRWHVTNIRRGRTRRVERRVATAIKNIPIGNSRKARTGRVDARRQLNNNGFITGDGQFVAWLDATADQHESRARWFEEHAASCTASGWLHTQAAADIRKAGVNCLRDLERVTA